MKTRLVKVAVISKCQRQKTPLKSYVNFVRLILGRHCLKCATLSLLQFAYSLDVCP